jgi:Heparinase II/III-like protein/Heparinase II/III N-terminus
VNWIWAVGTLEVWRPLEPRLRRRVANSLAAHGVNIWSNLEGTPYLRSNHYLANVLGLLAIGSVLHGSDEAARWEAYGRDELEREIRKEVYDDGVSFEGSLPYHGLALEMFLLGRHIASRGGKPLSQGFDERLRQMLAVSRAARHPNGRIPVFGDQDSGRVLPAGFDRPPTHDNLVWLGAAILCTDRPLAAAPDEEVAWTLGIDAWRHLEAQERLETEPPTRFPVGGVYVLRSRAIHCVVHCGNVGQGGNGGHAHNDTFSYELSLGDEVVVVDSGTYSYTFDTEARNAFRSTGAHNTVVVDEKEINPFVPELIFELRQTAQIDVDKWHESPEEVVFRGSHSGYERLQNPIRHYRGIRLDTQDGTLTIDDVLEGSGIHTATSLVHLSPNTYVERIHGATIEVRCGRVHGVIAWRGIADLSVGEGWVSDRYGVRVRAPLLAASVHAEAPISLSYEIRLANRDVASK